MLPGTYDLSVNIADKHYNLRGQVRAGATTGAPLPPKSFLASAYAAQKAHLTGKRALDCSIGFGLLGAGGLLVGSSFGGGRITLTAEPSLLEAGLLYIRGKMHFNQMRCIQYPDTFKSYPMYAEISQRFV